MNGSEKRHFPSKVLLPRFDTLGDIVLLQGFIQMILDDYPDTSITMLVRDGYDQLASLFSSKIIWRTTAIPVYQFINDDDFENLSSLLKNISNSGFDALFVTTFNRTWLDDIIAARLDGVFRVVLGQPRILAPWAADLHSNLGLSNTNLYELYLPVSENLPEIEKYQVLANMLFSNVKPLPKPKLNLNTHYADGLKGIIDDINLHGSDYYICVTTCTNSLPFKSWPEDRFVDIITWLYTEYSLTPFLVGHVSESNKLQSIESSVKARGIEPFIWLGKNGELDIMARLMKGARFYFGNDTGPMHIAAALGIPTVGIFGGGHWPRFLPVGNRAVGIAAEIPCFGCNWADCIFQDAPCVKLVTVEDVKKAIHMVLSKDLLATNYLAVMDDCTDRLKEFMAKCIALAREKQNDKTGQVGIMPDSYELLAYELQARLDTIQTSLSWRITKPLRWLGDKVRGIVRSEK